MAPLRPSQFDQALSALYRADRPKRDNPVFNEPAGLTPAPETRRNPGVSERCNFRGPLVVPPQKSFPYSDSNPRQATRFKAIRPIFGPIIFQRCMVLRSVRGGAISRHKIRVRSDRSASEPANGPAKNRARAIPINVPPRPPAPACPPPTSMRGFAAR